jgi:hypothetical protein
MATIKSVQHKSTKELPQEVKDFFNSMLSEHTKELGQGQFIDQINIGVSMHRKTATIETSSMDFLDDTKKGLEQYL